MNIKQLSEVIVGVGYGSEVIGRYDDKHKGPRCRTNDLWAKLRGYTDGTYTTKLENHNAEENAKIIEEMIYDAIKEEGYVPLEEEGK